MPDLPVRSSGLYGLFCLDGAPISEADARHLGMSAPQIPVNWLIDGHDSHFSNAVQKHSSAAGDILLVGQIAEADRLAARLGLPRNTPVAAIAAAALVRFGTQTPAEMLGEYSLLNREIGGRLTLMIGPTMRDRLHYVVAGSRVAVAPDLFRLARIGWVGSDVDEAGLLFRWGRAHIRSGMGDRTMLAAVRQLGPGESLVIDVDGRTMQSKANIFLPQPRWQGSFADAVAESEDMLRKIMRERMGRGARPAILLSGGLDSSLLAWLASSGRSTGQLMFALSSAAPADSGIADETPFAMQVAEHIGLECFRTVAADEVDFFRPPDKILSGASGPILSNRQCLTEAFQIAAKARGANMMVNGSYGESSVTAHLPVQHLVRRLRAVASQFYHGIRGTDVDLLDKYPFHIRIARHRLSNLPAAIRAAIELPRKPIPLVPKRNGLFGYSAGAATAVLQANEFYPGALRMDFPYRDMRLFRLFAGFPVAMLLEGGHDRPVVRSMMEGHIPDAIRLRRRGMPAEPDRFYRMQRQASAARLRIAEFRKADIDEWIDLDWLDAALLRVSLRGATDNTDSNEVQLTALAAEFLFWWRTRF